MPPLRTVWHEVTERRRTLHQQAGEASMETWTPADPAWTGVLQDVHDDVQQARADATSLRDPREALIDLLAVASAWIDAFDQRNEVT